MIALLLVGEVRAQCHAHAGTPSGPICEGTTQQLNGTANGGQGPYSYSWTPIGGLSDPNIANPVASPTTTTVYTLTITDNNGCTDTDNITVNVNPSADAAMTSSNAQFTVFNGNPTFYKCSANPTSLFSFDFSGTATGGSMHTISWGDASPNFTTNGATWPTQTHTYSQGINTITYTITQGNGCNDIQTYNVFLGTNPAGALVNPGSTQGCGPITLTFPIVGWATNTPGTIYSITFNDGTPPIQYSHPPPASITHMFSIGSCGTTSTDGVNTYQNSFSANMLVSNPCGTSGSTILPIVVSLAGSTDFTITPNDTACVNTTVTFTSTSTGNEVLGNSCDITPALLWSILPAAGWTTGGTLGNDNGFNGATYDPSSWSTGSTSLGVDFNIPGVYTIRLISGNSCGGDTLTRTVCIESPPAPSFTLLPITGCAPFQPVNTNTSVFGTSCLLTHEWTVIGVAAACGAGPAWSFASGNASSLQPQFLFTEPGTYTVQYRAINSCNVPLVQQVITVNAPPQVALNALSGICATQCVSPSAVVQNCGSAITTYAWTFPGGTPANAAMASPGSICFNAPGNPTISLTVTNACGNATANGNLAIGTLPPLPVIASNSPVCAGQILSLSATPIAGVTFQWTDPQGTVISNQPSLTIPNVTAANAGVYSVVAISSGCTGPAATVNVLVIAAPNVTINPPATAICNGQSTTLTANGAGNYQWFIGATQVGTGPQLVTSPAVTTTYTVSGNTGGCPGSATVNVTVYPLPVVNAGVDQTFCDQAIPVNLSGAPAPGIWSGPGVTPGGVFTPTPGQLGTVTLTYTHTNANGCTNTDQVDVTVQAVTQFANAGPDVTLCQSNTATQLIGAPAGGTWVGAGAGGWFTPSTVGNFNVTYNFGAGTCATSDQTVVNVVGATVLNVMPDFSNCADAAPIALVGNPVGGTWSGNGVSGPPWVFDPGAVAAGSHLLTYNFGNANGCQSTATVTATVNALPVVNAGPDVVLCNQPIAYQLGGAPAGGTWSGNTIAVTPGGQITPAGVDTDVLTYSVTNADGCSGSDQITVDIQPIVIPAFAGNDTSVCVNSGALQLNGTPAGGSWTGSQVNATGLLDTDTPGSYTLTYSFGTATCLLQDQISVVVNALPVVDAGTDIAVCLDGGVQILTANPAGGTWSGVGVDPATGEFDPTQALPGGNAVVYQYTDPGTGCSNSDNALVTVQPLPTADFSSAPIACANTPFAFTNNSVGAVASEWSFGDGTTFLAMNPSHTYLDTGAYDVQLVVFTTAGCTDTITQTVIVWDVPEADPILDVDNGCGPLTVNFDNQSIGAGIGYWWDFGGLGSSALQWPGSFTFPMDPQDAIVYPVTLTATNTCGSDAVTIDVTVMPAPTAVFGPNVNVHCSYADVPFANVSYGLPDTFQWDFGDGTFGNSAATIVTHSYVADTINTPFTITLIASNACGSDTADFTITVLPNDVVSFFNMDPVQGCAPLTVNFTHITSGDTALVWDLGDGNFSIAQDVSHTYNTPGTYMIELSAYGCGFDAYSQQITVFPSPVVAFTTAPQGVCVGGEFTFTNQTTGISGSQWTFGDGGISTLTSPTHSYATSGNFPVTLTVTSALNGCTSSITHHVNVSITPVAAFTTDPMDGCIDLDVAFTNASTGASFYQWNFGDGNTTGTAAPFHTYTTAGSYVVTLIAENVNGCADTITAPVVAHPLPSAFFSLSAAQSCTSPVTVQTLNGSQGAIGYQWDLGNGQGSILNQPDITFDQPGTFIVRLTATNQFGCTDQHEESFTVHPTPEASFFALPQPACAGRPIFFTNTSVNAFSFHWRFGDGSISVADTPMHTYAQAGTYSITLIATGAGGCVDTLAAPGAIIVNPTPNADYESDTLLSVRNALQFSNLSQGAVSYTWDFGDGEGSTDTHPLHLFPADGGGYTVCLVAVNTYSCPDTICKFQLVGDDAIVFVPNAFTPNDDDRNEAFRPIVNGYVGWKYTFLVFDRWGLEIFKTHDRNEGWNGRVGGKPPVIDVYVWKVIVERDGDARDYIGHVTLVD
ncbi:MAG: PKD domain-containing protein [Flavobacteriales bacterium]|nr:PKD domain-containing protein [Flavobacteriales bacterium]